MKVLLVDDDVLIRDMYAKKFTEAGHEVETADSGEHAVVLLQEQSFDVVLIDIVMPDLTGIELLTKMKKEKLGGSPKCIVLSNQSEGEDVAAAKDAGVDGYIVKAEMIPSEVVEKVESLVGTK